MVTSAVRDVMTNTMLTTKLIAIAASSAASRVLFVRSKVTIG